MTPEHDILQVTPRVEALAALCRSNSRIDPALYRKYDVKRGLRDINGQGVLAGLTNISDIISRKEIGGEIVPCEGELYYRGIRIQDLVQGFVRDGRKGYEEAAYLLLFGELPDAKRLGDFKALLAQGRTLPTNFTRDVIMKAPTRDMMNSLSRSVLTLASYDSNADDISLPNVLRQCLMLISVFPMLAVYSYHAYNHYECGGSMYIHYPSDSLSTASNFLRMLRPDMQYTPLEARVLDLALVLHMEHGGGNNSSFTTHVVTSSGTDTYSAIAAALGSLKGPKHGGANYKVVQMFEDMKKNGGFIPGVKPGRKTMEFLDTIMSRITLPGSIFLGIVAILPAFATIAGVNQQFAQFYGGTSLFILVGVVLDTLQQIESHLLMRHYDGLMKTGRIKGKTPGGPAAY